MTTNVTKLPYMPVKAKREDHATPPEILKPVRRIFGGVIDLDPCGNPHSIVGAKRQVWLPKWLQPDDAGRPLFVRPDDVIVGDGLEVPWDGNVFFNPPYSHVLLGLFMARAAALARARAGHAIGLIPSKTSLGAWHDYVRLAPAVCYLDHRVRHLLPGGELGDGAPFSQALVLWTDSRDLVDRFYVELDGKLGDVMFHRGA